MRDIGARNAGMGRMSPAAAIAARPVDPAPHGGGGAGSRPGRRGVGRRWRRLHFLNGPRERARRSRRAHVEPGLVRPGPADINFAIGADRDPEAPRGRCRRPRARPGGRRRGRGARPRGRETARRQGRSASVGPPGHPPEHPGFSGSPQPETRRGLVDDDVEGRDLTTNSPPPGNGGGAGIRTRTPRI